MKFGKKENGFLLIPRDIITFVCTAKTARAVIAAYEKPHVCVTAAYDGKAGQVGVATLDEFLRDESPGLCGKPIIRNFFQY